MTHDSLCPELWRYEDGQPCMFCALIARVREDDLRRLMRDDDYAYVSTQSYAAALRDALEVANDQRSKFKARDWDDAVDRVVAAIEALGGKQ